MSEVPKHAVCLYLPQELITQLDNSKGPFSRAKLIQLVLQATVRNGIDLTKLVTAGGS